MSRTNRSSFPELKAGYILQITDNDGEQEGLAMVTYGSEGKLCISGSDYWGFVEDVSKEGMREHSKITKVYGHAPNSSAYKMSTRDRELIWEEKILPICEVGYYVKIEWCNNTTKFYKLVKTDNMYSLINIEAGTTASGDYDSIDEVFESITEGKYTILPRFKELI